MKLAQHIRPDSHIFVFRTLCFIFYENNILLIRRPSGDHPWSNTLNAIGGHVEPSEGLYAAARREVLEEAGIEIPSLSLSGLVLITTGDVPDIVFAVFSGEVGDPQVTVSDEGLLDWFDVEAIPDNETMEDLPLLLERVMETRRVGSSFIAHYSYGVDGTLNIKFE